MSHPRKKKHRTVHLWSPFLFYWYTLIYICQDKYFWQQNVAPTKKKNRCHIGPLPPHNGKRSPNPIRTARRFSLFLLSFCVIGTVWFMSAEINERFLTKKVCPSPPKETKTMDRCGFAPLPPAPLTATSLQRPLCPVPKVAVVERFHCNWVNLCAFFVFRWS